jgi:hypothetical protein
VQAFFEKKLKKSKKSFFGRCFCTKQAIFENKLFTNQISKDVAYRHV